MLENQLGICRQIATVCEYDGQDTRLGGLALRIATCLVLAFCVLSQAACTPQIQAPQEQTASRAQPGSLYSIEPVGGYPTYVLRALVWWQGLAQKLPVVNGVSLYRLRYWTSGPDGKATVASGLVALPRVARLRGVVSFQHGTASERVSAPSTPDPQNGVLAAAAFAGRGYLLVAPDYVGLGTSDATHPYLHAATEASAVIDLLHAARGVVTAAGLAWPHALLLVGFSQGGHATLATQRALEATPTEGFLVRAAAPIAGPFDLAGFSFPDALKGRAESASLYLAYLTNAYAIIYAESLSSALREPYAQKVPWLFDGMHDGASIIAALPRNPREMFRDDFLQSFANGQHNWLRDRLVENGLSDWTPRAPIRLYYGDLDLDVSPKEAALEAERLRARGGNARAVSVGAYNHDQSVLEAVPYIVKWFDELTASDVSAR